MGNLEEVLLVGVAILALPIGMAIAALPIIIKKRKENRPAPTSSDNQFGNEERTT